MSCFLRVLRVDVEDLLRTIGGELGGQAGRLFPPELPVVRAAHLVAPAVSVRDCESDSVLVENLFEGCSVNGPGVFEGGIDLVPKRLLEAFRRELFTTQLPVGLGQFRCGQHPESLLSHEVVVELSQTVPPRREALEGLTREVVVVGDEDVCMPVAAGGVRVHDDEIVGRVHPLGELHRYVSDPFHVPLRGHIELVRVEGQHVRLEFVLAPARPRQRLRPFDEFSGRSPAVGHGHGERRSAGRLLLDEPLSTIWCVTVEDVRNCPCGITGGTDVDRAHVAVRSPRVERTASTEV